MTDLTFGGVISGEYYELDEPEAIYAYDNAGAVVLPDSMRTSGNYFIVVMSGNSSIEFEDEEGDIIEMYEQRDTNIWIVYDDEEDEFRVTGDPEV